MPDPHRIAPATAHEVAEAVREAAAAGSRLQICGGETALDFGGAVIEPHSLLSLRGLDRIVDFPARDMTVTVEAGMTVSRLRNTLNAQGLRLPVDVPQPDEATLGGAIACDVSGPLRFGHGSFRDFVIGIEAVDGEGRPFRSGGRVVKNVAGYDLAKLLIGSVGTLAAITAVTLKLWPIAEDGRWLWVPLPELTAAEAVLEMLGTSQTRPVAIELLNESCARQVVTATKLDLPTNCPALCLAYEGKSAEADWQVATVREELAGNHISEATIVERERFELLLAALTEFPVAAPGELAIAAGVLPSQVVRLVRDATDLGLAVLAHAGGGTVILRLPSELGNDVAAASVFERLREMTPRSHGGLTVLCCPEKRRDLVAVLAARPGGDSVMHKLKQALDPQGIFNPGRLAWL